MNLLECGYFHKEVISIYYNKDSSITETYYISADGDYRVDKYKDSFIFYKENCSNFRMLKDINANNITQINKTVIKLCPQLNHKLIRMLYGLD